jgi:hypothetical protein
MRISLLIIASLGLISSAVDIAQTPSAAASPPAGAAALDVVAMWEPRTLKDFGDGGSCDLLVDHARFMLLQLGAHDLKIDPRRCLGDGGYRTVDVTFWVLAPANKSNGTTRGVAARWQIVEMHPGDFMLSGCAYLKYVTQTILPLFSTRDVKLISNAVCNKTDVGLRAQVLVPVQPLADAR